jgi:hypothetical protein
MARLEDTAQSPYNVTPAPVQPAMPQVANNDFLQTIPFGLRSNTWRTQDAEMAKSLAKNGVDAISIYKQTGTWLSSDGKWRQEVAKGSQFQEGSGKAGLYKLPADYNIKSTGLNNITEAANAQYAKGVLSALLNNPTQSIGDAVKDVKNLFNPEYMKNVKGMSNEEAINLALDANPIMGAVTAFHGSPYRFDKFDATKIGSGEGAQAFGHGLYFAESPSVAGTYKDKLSSGVMLNDKFIDDVMINSAQDKIKKSVLMKLKNAGEVSSSPYSDVVANASKDELSYLKQIKPNLKTGSQTGSLYKVDIPDESIPKMLDWDKKISEQNSEVLNAIGINPSVAQKYNKIVSKINELSNVKGGLDSPEWNELIGQATELRSNYGLGLTGKDYYENLAINSVRRNGENFDHNKEAATALRLQGITGIRYLDRSSRAANEGTSNYVVFDDKLPKILERN